MHTYMHAHTDISNIHTIQTLTYTRKYAHAVTSIPPHTHTCSSSTSRVLKKYNISSVIAPPLSVKYFTPQLPSRPIVDQLYDNVPTLKSTSVCLNSLRVVSPGVQRRKSTRKDPVTRTESLVLTRLPPRAEATAYQYNGLVK